MYNLLLCLLIVLHILDGICALEEEVVWLAVINSRA